LRSDKRTVVGMRELRSNRKECAGGSINLRSSHEHTVLEVTGAMSRSQQNARPTRRPSETLATRRPVSNLHDEARQSYVLGMNESATTQFRSGTEAIGWIGRSRITTNDARRGI
jgi:hypothetical protein